MSRRLALVQDAHGQWFVRRLAYSVQDDVKGEMVYHCDKHISGPHKTLSAAVASLRKRRSHV